MSSCEDMIAQLSWYWQQVVGAPKKKKQKKKNDYVVQDKNKMETMVSKVSKESPSAV